MGEEEQQTEDSGDLSDEDDAVESEGGENIDLMKLDTKKNPKQKKFRLLDPREVPATKENGERRVVPLMGKKCEETVMKSDTGQKPGF